MFQPPIETHWKYASQAAHQGLNHKSFPGGCWLRAVRLKFERVISRAGWGGGRNVRLELTSGSFHWIGAFVCIDVSYMCYSNLHNVQLNTYSFAYIVYTYYVIHIKSYKHIQHMHISYIIHEYIIFKLHIQYNTNVPYIHIRYIHIYWFLHKQYLHMWRIHIFYT